MTLNENNHYDRLEAIRTNIKKEMGSNKNIYRDEPDIDNTTKVERQINKQKRATREASRFTNPSAFTILFYGLLLIITALGDGIIVKQNLESNFGLEDKEAWFGVFIVLMTASVISWLAKPIFVMFYTARNRKPYRLIKFVSAFFVVLSLLFMGGIGYFNGEVAAKSDAVNQLLEDIDNNEDEILMDIEASSNSSITPKTPQYIKDGFFIILTITLFLALIFFEAILLIMLLVFWDIKKRRKLEKLLITYLSQFRSIQEAKEYIAEIETNLSIIKAQINYLNYQIPQTSTSNNHE